MSAKPAPKAEAQKPSAKSGFLGMMGLKGEKPVMPLPHLSRKIPNLAPAVYPAVFGWMEMNGAI